VWPFRTTKTRNLSVLEALECLLESRERGERGGHVIFDRGCETEFVQFALEAAGLQLYWPIQVGGRTIQGQAVAYLQRDGFARVAPKELSGRTFAIEVDGLHALFSEDFIGAGLFVSWAFESVLTDVRNKEIRSLLVV
jgi:hypothetical protein